MTDMEVLVLHSNTRNHLTVWKQLSSGLFQMLTSYYSFKNHIHLVCIYIYKQDLALNKPQVLIGGKIKPTNQPTRSFQSLTSLETL